MSKSKIMKKWAKKHGVKFINLKLAKVKPDAWCPWHKPSFLNAPGILLFDELCDVTSEALWFWED